MTERAHQRNWNGDGSLKYFQESGAAGWNWFTRGREEDSSGNLPLPRTHEPRRVRGKAVGTDLHPSLHHDTTELLYINIKRTKEEGYNQRLSLLCGAAGEDPARCRKEINTLCMHLPPPFQGI